MVNPFLYSITVKYLNERRSAWNNPLSQFLKFYWKKIKSNGIERRADIDRVLISGAQREQRTEIVSGKVISSLIIQLCSSVSMTGWRSEMKLSCSLFSRFTMSILTVCCCFSLSLNGDLTMFGSDFWSVKLNVGKLFHWNKQDHEIL